MNSWRNRYGPAFAVFHMGMVGMAAHFGASIWVGGSPVTPELYGPAVYYIPALLWAAAQVAGAALSAFGAVGGGRFGWLVMAAGGILSTFVYLTFVVLAQRAEQGTIVQAAGLSVAIPISILTVLAGVGERNHG